MKSCCDYCDDGCKHCQPSSEPSLPVPEVNDDAYVCVAILLKLLDCTGPPLTHVIVGGQKLHLDTWNPICEKYAKAGHRTILQRVASAKAKQECELQELEQKKKLLPSDCFEVAAAAA